MKKQDQSYSDPKAANGKIALKDKLLHEPQRASRKEHHLRSGSPANFQNPDCPETGRFPSHLTFKNRKKIQKNIFFIYIVKCFKI